MNVHVCQVKDSSWGHLGLGVNGGSMVDQNLSHVDFILLGSQMERGQAGLNINGTKDDSGE